MKKCLLHSIINNRKSSKRNEKMDEFSMRRFFNQFIFMLRKKNIKNIGIITDKDGTLLLNDELRSILEDLRNTELGVNIHIIANSGRTVADMINCLKRENIPINYFEYIIGDNGRNVFRFSE